MRVITIAPASSEASCGDESGEVPKLNLPLTRRSMLRGSGVLMGTIAIGSPLAALAPSTVWAVELKTLSKTDGEALMAMGRVLYPHERLPDAVYALLAKDLDADAAKGADTAKLLKDGIAALDKAAGGSFTKANAAQKASAVKSLEGQPFFGAVRGKCITSLYDNDMAYKVFGYPGSAWEQGGYITRGFQDLKWLPEPPAAASPKPWMG
jgi:hypothetical protein